VHVGGGKPHEFFYMDNELTKPGYICLARAIQDSEIWEKPSDWLKIWVYILMEVKWEDSKRFKRGSNFFKYENIAKSTGATYFMVVRCMEWLKLATQITTQKATRGIVITIVNYDKYQNVETYQSNTESNAESNSKATQVQLKRNASARTITKEIRKKEIRNKTKDTNTPIVVLDEKEQSIGNEINQIIEIFYKSNNPTINFANKAIRNAAQSLIEEFGFEKTLSIALYATRIQGKEYAPTIGDPLQLKKKIANVAAFKQKELQKTPNVLIL